MTAGGESVIHKVYPMSLHMHPLDSTWLAAGYKFETSKWTDIVTVIIRMKHNYTHKNKHCLRARDQLSVSVGFFQQSTARLKSQVYPSLRHVFSIFS